MTSSAQSAITKANEIELMFHGTRADRFSKFDLNMLGTGEGANAANGIYFVTSLKGAGNHAYLKARQNGRPLIYVCTLSPSAIVLNFGKAIHTHSKTVQELWNELPVWYSTRNGSDWYTQIAFTPESSLCHAPEMMNERDRCNMLRTWGIDAIWNFESGIFADGYLHGRSHLVLNPDVIEIIEVLDAEDINDELCGPVKNYQLSDEFMPLGKTNVLSKLKEVSWL